METYVKKWIDIIEGMNNSNTYKLAWGKAILECTKENYYEENNQIFIHHKDISINMMRYYWNQTFFFDLKQGPNITDMPVMYQLINEMIDLYKKETNHSNPVWFDTAYDFFMKNPRRFQKYVTKFITVANQNVSHRFLNLRGQIIDLYTLNKKDKTISFEKSNFTLLQEYEQILKLILNYKWAQLLEMYNRTPKIASKVENSSNAKIKRSNLIKFKKLLLKSMEDGKIIDFYTGELLEENNISIDHVIPWSFMYSDDLWNLVITSKSHNSSKSNKVVDEEFIDKLRNRNKNIVSIIEKIDSNESEKLKESLRNDYVGRYYNDLKY